MIGSASATAYTDADFKLAEAQIGDAIAAAGDGTIKVAQEFYSTYLRSEIIEDSFWNAILPPEPAADKLTPSVDHDDLEVLVEIEGRALASMVVPFGTTMRRGEVRATKGRVRFSRVVTPLVTADVDRLRSWQHDIREVTSSKMVRNMGGIKDYHFILSVNTMLLGPNQVMPGSRVAQWRVVNGGYTRAGVVRAVNDPLTVRPNELKPEVALMNNLTVANIVANLGHEAIGGPAAADMFEKGMGDRRLYNDTPIKTTKKKGLVPTGAIYTFPDPTYLGRSYELHPAIMHVARKMWMVEFGAYECIGGMVTDNVGRSDIRD